MIYKTLSEIAAQRRRNVLGDIADYFSSESTWPSPSTCPADYSVVYNHACDQWLKAYLIFGEDLRDFTAKYLCTDRLTEIDTTNASPNELLSFSRYFMTWSLVRFVIDSNFIKEPIEYSGSLESKYLESFGYSNFEEIINDGDLTENVKLEFITRHLIRYRLLGSDIKLKNNHPRSWSVSSLWRTAVELLSGSPTKGDLNGLLRDWVRLYLESKCDGFGLDLLAWVYAITTLRLNGQPGWIELREKLANALNSECM